MIPGRCCNCGAPALGGWCSTVCERSRRLLDVVLRDVLADDDELRRARLLAEPGCCAFCEEPLPRDPRPGTPRIICAAASCKAAYMAAYRRDRRAGVPPLRRTGRYRRREAA